jgi:hypothetical protein
MSKNNSKKRNIVLVILAGLSFSSFAFADDLFAMKPRTVGQNSILETPNVAARCGSMFADQDLSVSDENEAEASKVLAKKSTRGTHKSARGE